MPELIEIQSPEDPRLDVYARLTEPQLRSRRSPAGALFIAESGPVIEWALRAGCRPVSLLMARRHVRGKGKAVLEHCGDVPVFTGDDEMLAALTGFYLSRGILCAMERPAPRTPEEVIRGAQRLAILERIGDSANLGAIFRSAAALGVDGLLLSPDCADPLNRRCCRVSMGGVFQIPWARLDRWPEEDLARLRGSGFFLAALALREDSLSLEDPRLAGAPRLALLLGSEGDGLSEAAIRLSDAAVRIPMARGADSLNVAAAAAVAFWETRRR